MLDNENELIKRCKIGDLDAFETLIMAYEKKAYNIAYRMMGNEEDAKDVAQEALLKIYRNMINFKEESAFSTWLYRIVTNTCLDELRKKKNMYTQSIDQIYEGKEGDVHIELAIDYTTPESVYVDQETREIVVDAMNELSEDYKSAIVLREIEGLSYDEIADVLDCSLGTVKSRINRARNALKEKLRGKLELNKQSHV